MLKFVKPIYILFLFSICQDVSALTLDEALINAYKVNPELNAQRETLKAADEQIMQSLSRWLPSVTVQSIKNYSDQKKVATAIDSKGAAIGVHNSVTDGVSHDLIIRQNLFRGGADIASMQVAYYSIKKSRADLDNAEQKLFLKVVGAYMSSLETEENYKKALESEKDSNKILQSITHRFKAGDASKTDVELAKATVARAKSGRVTALANYESSKANFEYIIGMMPSNLVVPKDGVVLPENLNETIDRSILKNPNMVISRSAAEAEKKNIDVQKGDVLPSVDLLHQINDDTQQGYGSTRGLRSHVTQIQLNFPLFAVGEWSQIRAQKRRAASAQSSLASTTDSVKANALQAWVGLKAQKESMKALEEEYKARSAAYKGAQALEKAGQMSIIDLIEVKNQYFNSYAQYVKTRSDYYTALYTLKSMVGECTASGLGLKVPYYDPLKNYNSIKWQLIGAF